MSSEKDRFDDMLALVNGEDVPPPRAPEEDPPPLSPPPQKKRKNIDNDKSARGGPNDPHLLTIKSDLPSKAVRGAQKLVVSPVHEGWIEIKTGRTLGQGAKVDDVVYKDLFFFRKRDAAIILMYTYGPKKNDWRHLGESAGIRIFKQNMEPKRTKKEAIDCQNRIPGPNGEQFPFWPDTLYAKALGVTGSTEDPSPVRAKPRPKKTPPTPKDKKESSSEYFPRHYDSTDIPDMDRFDVDKMRSEPSTSAPAPDVVMKEKEAPSVPVDITGVRTLEGEVTMKSKSKPKLSPPRVRKRARPAKKKTPVKKDDDENVSVKKDDDEEVKEAPAKKARVSFASSENNTSESDRQTYVGWMAKMFLTFKRSVPDAFRKGFQDPALRILEEEGLWTEAEFKEKQRTDPNAADLRAYFFLNEQHIRLHPEDFKDLKDRPVSKKKKDIFDDF